MNKNALIIITGAAGFIGSCLIARLNELGYHNLMLVDDFSSINKVGNLINKKYQYKIHRLQFLKRITHLIKEYENAYMFHIGARTDTTSQDNETFERLNFAYSKAVWDFCTQTNIPLVYASSAATYGNGNHGYKDNLSLIPRLEPLNSYAWSKQNFDLWALEQTHSPSHWYGLKFFNVYGPNEYHKGRMASVAFHSFHQIARTGEMQLFQSHKPDYENGEQSRDFIYVKDVVETCIWLMDKLPANDIFNLGTGKAESFNSLAKAIFSALNLSPNISYIPTPEDIRDSYQYFTEADMSKLIQAGYIAKFHTIEEGISDYINNYLIHEQPYW